MRTLLGVLGRLLASSKPACQVTKILTVCRKGMFAQQGAGHVNRGMQLLPNTRAKKGQGVKVDGGRIKAGAERDYEDLEHLDKINIRHVCRLPTVPKQCLLHNHCGHQGLLRGHVHQGDGGLQSSLSLFWVVATVASVYSMYPRGLYASGWCHHQQRFFWV